MKSKIHDTFSRIYRQLMAADLSMNNEEDGEQIEWRRKKKRSELATTVDWVEHEFIHLEGMYLTITEMYKIESNHISVKFWQEMLKNRLLHPLSLYPCTAVDVSSSGSDRFTSSETWTSLSEEIWTRTRWHVCLYTFGHVFHSRILALFFGCSRTWSHFLFTID